jgi:acylphosphatase
MESMRVRTRVVVAGRVQGVWFRQSTAERARELGVDGWVRNLSDGRVEAVFEGDPVAVSEAVEYAKGGPERARVDEAEVTDETPSGEAGFAVR